MINDPCKWTGSKVQRRCIVKSFRNLYGRILRSGIYILGCQRESGCQIGDEINANHQHHQSDDKCLEHISFGNRQHQREEIEHACQRCQRQEFISRQDDRKENNDGYQQQRNDQRGRMTDDQRRAHADVQPGSVLEFAGYQLARSIGNRHQTLNEQSRNAGNQFHDGSHLYAQHQNLGQFVTGKHPYQAPHYDAQKQRLAQQAKAFLQTFGIDTATLEQYVEEVTDAVTKWFSTVSGEAAQAAANAAAGVAGAAMDSFVTLAVSIYLLTGKEMLLHALRTCLRAALPPRKVGSVFSVCAMANRTFSGYIGGQLLDALLVGFETFFLMSLFRLDYAPLIAVLVGVTNIIPVLGPFIGAVPGAVILLLESPLQAVEFVLIILVVQQVDGNFIAPRILGGATGLPGLGVLLAIIVGGSLFGIPGMVIGVPTLAVIVTLIKQAVGAGLTARGIDENGNPLPEPETK